jgi:transposase InsO family protein
MVQPSQGWRTFLRNHTGDFAAVDLFVVPTIGFKRLYALLILSLERRRLVWTNVTASPTAEWIARQLTEAFPWEEAPRFLIRDRDSSYGIIVARRLRAMGIRDRPIPPRAPWQNGHVERLIGSIRRECLDHVVILGQGQLRRLLANHAAYHNRVRTRLALDRMRRFTDRRRPSVVLPRSPGLVASNISTSGSHNWQAQAGAINAELDIVRSP